MVTIKNYQKDFDLMWFLGLWHGGNWIYDLITTKDFEHVDEIIEQIVGEMIERCYG